VPRPHPLERVARLSGGLLSDLFDCTSTEAREADGHFVRELHGVNLTYILEYLVHHLGFETMATQVNIKCFSQGPSVKSSLAFLRRTPWARTKVEALYVDVRGQELAAAIAHEPLASPAPNDDGPK
jgi:uncharacterized protein (DUF2132 family)